MLMNAAKIGLCAAIVALSTIPSHSAECGKRDKVIAILADKYQEVRKGIGLISNGGIMELFVSKQSGSWTVLFTRTDEISCILAAGDNFSDTKGLPLDPGA